MKLNQDIADMIARAQAELSEAIANNEEFQTYQTMLADSVGKNCEGWDKQSFLMGVLFSILAVELLENKAMKAMNMVSWLMGPARVSQNIKKRMVVAVGSNLDMSGVSGAVVLSDEERESFEALAEQLAGEIDLKDIPEE